MEIRVSNTGLRLVATATSSAPTTLPVATDSTFPRYIRIGVEPLTTVGAFAYVKLGTMGQNTTALNTDLMITTYEPVIMHTRGFTNVSVMGGTGVLTVYVNVVPLEGG